MNKSNEMNIAFADLKRRVIFFDLPYTIWSPDVNYELIKAEIEEKVKPMYQYVATTREIGYNATNLNSHAYYNGTYQRVVTPTDAGETKTAPVTPSPTGTEVKVEAKPITAAAPSVSYETAQYYEFNQDDSNVKNT